jgi:hypothetical protein
MINELVCQDSEHAGGLLMQVSEVWTFQLVARACGRTYRAVGCTVPLQTGRA